MQHKISVAFWYKTLHFRFHVDLFYLLDKTCFERRLVPLKKFALWISLHCTFWNWLSCWCLPGQKRPWNVSTHHPRTGWGFPGPGRWRCDFQQTATVNTLTPWYSHGCIPVETIYHLGYLFQSLNLWHNQYINGDWWFWWLFPHLRGFWDNVWLFIPHLRFLLLFVFEVEISSHTLIPLFMPGSVHSGSASWDDYDQIFLDKMRVSSFLDKFPHYAWTTAQSAHWLPWIKDICVFSRCNLPPALLAEWPGSFTCHCSNAGVKWTLDILLVGAPDSWSKGCEFESWQEWQGNFSLQRSKRGD